LASDTFAEISVSTDDDAVDNEVDGDIFTLSPPRTKVLAAVTTLRLERNDVAETVEKEDAKESPPPLCKRRHTLNNAAPDILIIN
jgi:hypothetical protein